MLIWEKTYGGSDFEQPFGSEPTSDGGIILGGHSLSNDGDITSNFGDYDWWIFKVDSEGEFVWKKSYGGSLYDKCRYATENPDGTSLGFGSVKSNDHDVSGNHTNGENDYWLTKLDTVGNIIWSKCYGGTQEEGGRSVIRCNDGNYLVAGYTHSSDGDVNIRYGGYDVWLLKVNANDGSIIWEKNYGGTKDERVRSISQWPNGDFVFSGNTESENYDLAGTVNHNGEDIYVSRIDSSGSLKWAVQYGGPGKDRAYYCTRDVDGNVLIAGKDSSNGGDVSGSHGESDVWVLKLKYSDGSLMWEKAFGGSSDDEGFRINPTPDGGYIIGATSESSDGDSPGNRGHSDYWFIKVDSALNIQWTRTDGGPGYDHLNDIILKDDGTFVGIGFSNSDPGPTSEVSYNHGNFDAWLVKVGYCDSTVSTSPSGIMGIAAGEIIELNGPSAESWLWSTGETTQKISVSKTGLYTVQISKLSGACVRTSLPVNIVPEYTDGEVFPNPALNELSVLLSMKKAENVLMIIYDASGKKVLQQNLSLAAGFTITILDIKHLARGAYGIEAKGDAAVLLKKKFVKK